MLVCVQRGHQGFLNRLSDLLSLDYFHLGIFEWGMLYKEGPLPEKEVAKRKYHSEPYNSPTHAGGLFAIKRSWFKELGWYDPGMCFEFDSCISMDCFESFYSDSLLSVITII